MKKRPLIAVLIMVMAIPFLMISTASADSTAWLGIYTQTVDKDLKEAFDLNSDKGVIVKYVVPDSPADQAGLRQGDIVLKIDNQPTDDADQLVDIVTNHKPGDEISMLVIRNGKEKTIKATLDERENRQEPPLTMHPGQNFGPAPKTYTKTWTNRQFSSNNTYIGIGLESMSDQLAKYFGVENGTGVLVTEVYKDSPAEKAGLKAGDVITKVDGKDFDNVSDIQNAVQDKKEGEKIDLTVLRNKQPKEFTLNVEEAPDTYGNVFPHNGPDGNWDNFQFNLPRMQGLFRGDTDDNGVFDAQNFREQMKDLQKEMDQLKKELQDLRQND